MDRANVKIELGETHGDYLDYFCDISGLATITTNYTHEKHKLPDGAKNLVSESDGKLYYITEDQYIKIIDDIVDVKVYGSPENPDKVIVYFSDGSFETAKTHSNDRYKFPSKEEGIGICVSKKLLRNMGIDGSSVYNKLITRGLKVYNRKQKETEAAINAENEAKRIRENHASKKRKRKDRIRKREEERQIRIHTEAILRANKVLSENV